MQPSRRVLFVPPRRSILLIGIMLCLIVALALALLIVEPMLAAHPLILGGGGMPTLRNSYGRDCANWTRVRGARRPTV
jgi:cobalamin biosynthesis protein CobD/CbiB